jgi:hypothetical protein
VPRTVKLAIKGRDETELLITHYVCVPLHLSNGTWEAGRTYFKVATLEEPYSAILRAPFLTKHRIDVCIGPIPALLGRLLVESQHWSDRENRTKVCMDS